MNRSAENRTRELTPVRISPSSAASPARAPYFHNGFAADLGAVVDFYDSRFAVQLSAGEKSDLVAFLRTL